jgi:hypothetical protein
MNLFRTLRADEIDCRISQIKEQEGKPSGLTLLLYKDARCDQNILDETVGAYNWKREHTRDNRNCIVSLWDAEKGQWISKEDTGTESNTEKEKGLASDSFKRACFNWGIGRELYTAPFIWIKKGDFNFKDGKCYDRFTVKGIGYTDGVITGLEIKNQATGKICYKWGNINEEAPEKPEQPDDEPEETKPAETKPIRHDAPATVTTAPTLPNASPVTKWLAEKREEMRKERGLTAQENSKLFSDQKAALVKAGMAPDKGLSLYTMEEAEALIDAMYKNFTETGTEVIAK